MIEWRDDDGRSHRGSLFATFAALARGQARSFSALRPHQREPWHAFTVQVAAMALIRAGSDALPDSEAAWRELLIGLTPEHPDGEAWELVVDDWTRPALLQPPIVAATDRAAYRNRLPTPDALDMLVTAKNHDVKQERMVGADDQAWLFALVTLQTTEGFLGKGNYGISRMNGGFASRMSLGIRPGNGGAGAAFRRDVQTLVQDATERNDRSEGIPLLWTLEWDGKVSLNHQTLDELYVEICRRIRFRRTDANCIEALAAGSDASRVAYKLVGGNTGDPWAPLTIDKKKESPTYGKLVSFTAQGSGFGYHQMSRLLNSAKTTPSPMSKITTKDDADSLTIVASALVRGQGKTEGLHRRAIRIGGATGGKTSIDRIGKVSDERAREAGDSGGHLRRALMALVQGGTDKMRLDDDSAKKKIKPWLDHFDQLVDAEFFDAPF